MKKLITILLLLPLFIHAQIDKAIDDKIASALKDIPLLKSDTIGYAKSVEAAGVIYIDTLTVNRNEGGWFELWISSGQAFGGRLVYVNNTAGTNIIVINKEPYPFTGLVGGKFEVVLLNNKVVVKVTGTAVSRKWKYARFNKTYL